MRNLDNINQINQQATPEKNLEQQEIEAIIMKSENGKGSLSKDDFFKLLEADQLESLKDVRFKMLTNFTGLDNEVALKLLDVEKGDLLIYNLNQFVNVDYEKLAFRIVEMNRGAFMLRFLDRFKNIDHEKLALKFVESGDVETLMDNLKVFHLENHDAVVNKIIDSQKDILKIINHFSELSGLTRKTGERLMFAMAGDYFSLDKLIAVNDYYSPPLDKMLVKAQEIFGDEANRNHYKMLKRIFDNDQATISELGLKRGGEDGIREIQEKIRGFKVEILNEKFNPEVLIKTGENALSVGSIFKSAVRYEDSDWGDHDEDSFSGTIRSYLEYNKNDGIKPLNKDFRPSEYLDVKKVDTEAREKYVFNEHFLNRFRTLVNSIKEAKKLYLEKFPLTQLVERVEEKRIKLLAELRQKSNAMPNAKAQEEINKKIESLEVVNVRDVNKFQENFSVIAQNKEFNEDLREAVFLMGFAKNRQILNYDVDKINLDKPEIGDISWTLNFIDHVTNQETMSQYFTDTKSVKLFNDITSTQAIKDEMAIFQNHGDGKQNTTRIQFIPTRGILMEFSGHIADACWASKYDSIAAEYPEFTSVIIRQNPETKHERLAGAFMLIETESTDGQSLIVIRGLNPIENLINQLSVPDFYDKVKAYVAELAEKTGRKPAIVIDDHCGGSGTNRPVLFNHLNELKLENVKVDDESTRFNDYKINNTTWLLE